MRMGRWRMTGALVQECSVTDMDRIEQFFWKSENDLCGLGVLREKHWMVKDLQS